MKLRKRHEGESDEDRARRHVRNAHWEMRFWMVSTVPYMLWLRESVAVVGLLSIYALVLTAGSKKAAAESEVAGYANPKMGEDDAGTEAS